MIRRDFDLACRVTAVAFAVAVMLAASAADPVLAQSSDPRHVTVPSSGVSLSGVRSSATPYLASKAEAIRPLQAVRPELRPPVSRAVPAAQEPPK